MYLTIPITIRHLLMTTLRKPLRPIPSQHFNRAANLGSRGYQIYKQVFCLTWPGLKPTTYRSGRRTLYQLGYFVERIQSCRTTGKTTPLDLLTSNRPNSIVTSL